MTDPIAGARWRILQGDSLQLLRDLPDGCVDAVVTDPPYASTGSASSFVKTGGSLPTELQFYRSWLTEFMAEVGRVVSRAAAVWLTIDWRGALAFEDACSRLGWARPKVGIWDRGGLGMGYALRNTFECFALTYRGGWQPRARDVPDVWRYPWSPGNRTLGHSAEKPVVMLRRAVSLLAAPGALVLDPFSGSGSTGEAALLEGCRFIGIEQDEEWCEVARSRLASIGEHGEAVSEEQPSLFGGDA